MHLPRPSVWTARRRPLSDMHTDPLIRVSNLSVGFANRAGTMLPVLRNIDLTVHRGESVGLVGESGSGKSTLALAAMGYLKAGLQVLGGTAHFREHDMFGLARPALPPRQLPSWKGQLFWRARLSLR